MRLRVLQYLQILEVPIGECFIGQRPQPLGRLQFRCIRGQEAQVYPRWDVDLGTGMPARAIESYQDLLARPRADRSGELGQGEREGGDRHGRQQQPPGPTRIRMDKGIEIAPLVAMLDDRLGALAPGAPDPAHDRLEPDAVLVGRPQLYGVLGIGVLERLDGRREVFLKAAWAVGSALAWRGRGTFAVQPKRRNVSHPRWGCT